MEAKDVIIIGGGPAGLTAAIYTSRAFLSTVIFSGRAWGGQLMLTTKVENYPGFPQGILGPDLMQKFADQAHEFGAQILKDDVKKVDFSKKPFLIEGETNSFLAQSVIIATGAASQWLGLPNEQRLIGKGVSVCATCDGFFFKDKKVAVVGGGNSAMEEALALTKFASQVTIINRSENFKATPIMLERVKSNPKINILTNKIVVDILGKEKVEGLVLEDVLTSGKLALEVSGVFIAIGRKPATEIFQGQLELDQKGYIVIHEKTKTSIDAVFVAGDAADPAYRQAVTAAGFGCMAAMDLEKWFEEKKSD